jgi:hypothetical protein
MVLEPALHGKSHETNQGNTALHLPMNNLQTSNLAAAMSQLLGSMPCADQETTNIS